MNRIIILLLILLNAISFKQPIINKSIISLKALKKYDDFNVLLNAIEYYNKNYSHKSISLTFQYPKNDTIPETLQGYPLGNMIRRIRYSGLYNDESYRLKLEKVGVYVKAKQKIETVLKALQIYKDLYGDVNVDRNFIVTEDLKSHFPENCINMKLGLKAAALRGNKHTLSDEVVKKLDGFGFRWKPSYDNFMLFYKALRIYKKLHGHLDIPREYLVPSGDVNYDVNMHGMKVGRKVLNVRNRGDFLANHREELESIGLCIDSNVYDSRHWDEFLLAFQTFREIHQSINVPFDYIVPSDSSYPQECHGLKLGYRVHNIKYRGDFVIENERYKQILLELGFGFRY